MDTVPSPLSLKLIIKAVMNEKPIPSSLLIGALGRGYLVHLGNHYIDQIGPVLTNDALMLVIMGALSKAIQTIDKIAGYTIDASPICTDQIIQKLCLHYHVIFDYIPGWEYPSSARILFNSP